MCIVVLLVAVLSALGFSAIQSMEAEAPGLSVDRVAPHISSTAKTLWLIYLGMTLIEIVLLTIGGCAGSSGDGIKVIRIVVLFKTTIPRCDTLRILVAFTRFSSETRHCGALARHLRV